ncbi:methyltransferase [Microbacterium sp. STN6]|uniref:class I SAM-dependent methyltransferase n=1 Tax=Microbacterium sp. STN6 TaxID=2995588 RepID=UPI0022609E76|nr:methyltransferase [Microbacterium sp. STN6]MCX7522885.1 methyltransferase [Microbacterium sp. STN6]
MPPFTFDALRRWPDVEAPNLHAVDAADRLILDTAAGALTDAGAAGIVVIGDRYGALTLGAASLRGEAASESGGIRTHQDPLSGERALAANAKALGLEGSYRSLPLGVELLDGARVVLLQLPRSLAELDEIAWQVARHAASDVQVFAGGMLKHMTRGMNEVLGAHFGDVSAGLARQKARVLTARGLTARGPKLDEEDTVWPVREWHDDLALWVCAHGGAFAGTAVDIGTRFLLEYLDQAAPAARSAIDLGCGTGVLATALALRRPGVSVLASDQSAAAVASARATVEANGVADRVSVVRDDALSAQPDASAELILLNPPFHVGASVHAGVALRLIADAARVLAPGGELWCVYNSHLGYRGQLEALVGPTRQVGRNAKFTVTVSQKIPVSQTAL